MTLEIYPNDNRTRPHTKVIVDTSALGASSSDSQKAIVVFGSAQGGIPGEFYKLTSYAQAKSIFKGGDLLDFTEIAWNPSDTVGGAGIIYAMRIDSATQAILSKPGITFSSYQYGSAGNRVSVNLEAGSIANSYKLTAYASDTQTRETYDNLGRIMDISLKPSSTVPYASVDVKSGVLTLKSGQEVDSAAVVAQFTLSEVSSVSSLATQIGMLDDFQAFVLPYGDKNIDLTKVEDLAVTKVSASSVAQITSLLGDLLNQLQYSSLVSASANATVGKLAPFSLTQLQGGSDGTAPTTWAPFFNKLRTEDIPYAYYVVPLTPNQLIQSELSSVITDLTSAGYPLRAIVGGELGETIQYTLSRKSALSSSRVTLIGDDYVVKMADGRQLTLPAYKATAFIAGVASGLPNGEPITYKEIRVVKSLRSYTSDELDNMYSSGVVVAEKVRDVITSFRFVGDPTTKDDTNDPVSSSMSLGEETDFLVTALRKNLDNSFIGIRSTATTANDVKVAVSTFLLVKKNAGEIQNYDASNIVASLMNDRIDVSFTIVPSRGVNKIIVNMGYVTETQVSQ